MQTVLPGDKPPLYPDPTPRTAHILALVTGLSLACADRKPGGECLPAASDEPQRIDLESGGYLEWYCVDPPPADLRTGGYHTKLIWVEGEDCDPCDRETIASRAMAQVCADLDTTPPVRLLCGPVDYPHDPWDRKGCVYAVADPGECPIY